jgi:TM2 domain-containing membrane protein YozV
MWLFRQSLDFSDGRLRSIQHRYALVAGLAILPCMVYIWARDPNEQGFTPPCLFLTLTGFYCPGCGTLRGLHQLLNGNILAAFWLNPLIFLSIPFIVCAFLIMGSRSYRMKLPRIASNPNVGIFLCLAIVISYSILRNTNIHLFSSLRL